MQISDLGLKDPDYYRKGGLLIKYLGTIVFWQMYSLFPASLQLVVLLQRSHFNLAQFPDFIPLLIIN